MPQIELTPDEFKVLREVLTTSLGELKTEIADTDDHDFRNLLRRKEAVLAAIVGRLAD